MSKPNALAGLIGCYGDSGDESDDGEKIAASRVGVPTFSAGIPPPGMIPSVLARSGMHSLLPPPLPKHEDLSSPSMPIQETAGPTIHPAPIAHCPWSACYDEGSGFTYYWNQTTNEVTWEAPPEYLLALKLAQQQLTTSGSTEVSAEEWQLYQQALIEKQKTKISKPSPAKAKKEKSVKDKNGKPNARKRCYSEDENEKIELITSYHNSDSDSEPETPAKLPETKPAHPTPKPVKVPQKKVRTKEFGPTLPKQDYIEPMGPALPSYPVPIGPATQSYPEPIGPVLPTTSYTEPIGPVLPPNQNYSEPIGPVLPSQSYSVPIGPALPTSQDDTAAIGPELPAKVEVVLQNGVKIEDTPAKVDSDDSQDETSLLQRLKDKAKLLEKLGGELPSGLEKIIKETDSGTSTPIKSIDDIKPSDIDDLLEEIEKKELPKSRSKKIDMFDENSQGSIHSQTSVKSGTSTPTPKPLFPSSKNIDEAPTLFPSAPSETEKENKPDPIAEKKETNVYLSDPSEFVERPRKKLRISNSVLPVKKTEIPSYTTKYSQHIEGFSSERVGLGFSQTSDGAESSKAKTISYGNGLTFTKGEVLNEKDEELEDLTDLVEAKLKHLNELQPGTVTPVQEMLIQMQTLVCAWRGGALSPAYWGAWARGAGAALALHEAGAAPPGWTCAFQRSAGRYRYTRADGFEQWEYPAVADTDMDICTTPPPPPAEEEQAPPLPPSQPPPPPPPPPAPSPPITPPPPAWHDPPPPGCDDLPLPVTKPKSKPITKPKQEIGDELLSFYNDIAELERRTPEPEVMPEPTPAAPEPAAAPEPRPSEIPRLEERETTPKPEKEKTKKKSKLKISTSMGMKHKTVSSMVAKWQQVADEINSD